MFPNYKIIKNFLADKMHGAKLVMIANRADFLEEMIGMGLLPERPLDLMIVIRTCGLEKRALVIKPKIGSTGGYKGCFTGIGDESYSAFAEMAAESKKMIVFYSYPNSQLQEFEDNPKITMTCLKTHQFAAIEDKLELEKILRQAVPENIIPSISCISGNCPDFSGICRQLATRKLVVQKSLSGGGDGTYFANSPEELREILKGLPNNISLKISRFQEGYESNGQAVVTKNGHVYIDPPSHKIIGLPEVYASSSSGGGNDWSKPFPEELLKIYQQSMVNIGRVLWKNYGYIGWFGVDNIFDFENNKIWTHEINPRVQGTTAYQTWNALKNGRIPAEVIHYLSFLEMGEDLHSKVLPPPDEYNRKSVFEKGCWYLKFSVPPGYTAKMKEDVGGCFLKSGQELRRIEVDNPLLFVTKTENTMLVRGEKKGWETSKGLIPIAYAGGFGKTIFKSDKSKITPDGKDLATMFYNKFVELNKQT